MKFEWTHERIRFMQDASEYHAYHALLAGKLAPLLPPDGHICDMGCGLGHLSLALAPQVRQVTAVDISPDALAVLRSECERQKIGNIRTVCAGVSEFRPQERFDAMVFCLFGSLPQILAAGKAQCGGPVVLIKRTGRHHGFSASGGRPRRDSFENACRALAGLSIPFKTERFALEMGQPLRSVQEAERFLRLYGWQEDPAALERELSRRLTRTRDPEFPFYLPARRELGRIVLQSRDIPDWLTQEESCLSRGFSEHQKENII